MDASERGDAIATRALNLGHENAHQLWQAMRSTMPGEGLKAPGRETVTAALHGTATESKMRVIEAFLDRREAEKAGTPVPAVPTNGNGNGDDEGEGPIRVTLHGIHGSRYDIDELVATGHDADAVAEAISRILDRVEKNRQNP